MNIYDISDKAGVSIATVSRVLNGSEKVSEATRKKVLAVMEENSYMPNAFARSLGLKSMSTVGILCSDSSDIYLQQSIYYLERELRKNSYTSMVCFASHELEEKKKQLQFLQSRNVDAVILVGSHFIEDSKNANKYILEMAKKVPIIILNGELRGKNIYSVVCDDFLASQDITDLVISAGSKSPIYLYRTLSYSGKKKVEGFLKACEENELDVDKKRTYSCLGDMETICEFLNQIRKSGVKFDAVITTDDELAVGAVKYAISNELSIPEELQVAGYNNSILSVCSTPEITSVDNGIEYMCVTGISMLMQVFQGMKVPTKMMYSASIVEHGTTR